MRPSGTAAARGSGPDAGDLAFALVDWRKSDLVAVDGSVLERSTPSFSCRLAVDLGDADLRRQTAEVSRAPTIPQRVPDASVYCRLSPTRGPAGPSRTRRSRSSPATSGISAAAAGPRHRQYRGAAYGAENSPATFDDVLAGDAHIRRQDHAGPACTRVRSIKLPKQGPPWRSEAARQCRVRLRPSYRPGRPPPCRRHARLRVP